MNLELLDLPTDVFVGILDILFGGYLSQERLRTFCSLARTCKAIEAILKEYARGPKYGWWKYYKLATVYKPAEFTYLQRSKHRQKRNNEGGPVKKPHKIYIKPHVFNPSWGRIKGGVWSSWNAIQRKNLDLYSKGIIFCDNKNLQYHGLLGYVKNFSRKVRWWTLDLAKYKRATTPGLRAAKYHLTDLIKKIREDPESNRLLSPITSIQGYSHWSEGGRSKKIEENIVIRGLYCSVIDNIAETNIVIRGMYRSAIDDIGETKQIIKQMINIVQFRSHFSGHWFIAACKRYFGWQGIDDKKLMSLGVGARDFRVATKKIIKICLLVPNKTDETVKFLWRLIAKYIHLWGRGLGLIRGLFELTDSMPTWAAKKIKYYATAVNLRKKSDRSMVEKANYQLRVATGEKKLISPAYWPSRIVDYTPRTLPKPTVDKKRRGKAVMDKYKKLQRGYKAAVRFLKGGGYSNGEYDCVDWWYLSFYEDHMIG